MKGVLMCAMLFVMCACMSTKNNSKPEAVNPEKQLRAVGTVVLGNEPCTLLIRVYHKDSEFLIVPLNLEEKFKVDGMKLRFNFTEVENPQTNKCRDGKTTSLEEVTRLRQ